MRSETERHYEECYENSTAALELLAVASTEGGCAELEAGRVVDALLALLDARDAVRKEAPDGE